MQLKIWQQTLLQKFHRAYQAPGKVTNCNYFGYFYKTGIAKERKRPSSSSSINFQAAVWGGKWNAQMRIRLPLQQIEQNDRKCAVLLFWSLT